MCIHKTRCQYSDISQPLQNSPTMQQLTFPVRDTSPVIATSFLMDLLRARDMRADTIVTPALGPSLGTAPSGT